MTCVLHVVDRFLARSETFIYNYLVSHRRYDAHVLCRRRENESEFPFDHITAVGECESKRQPGWWLARGFEQLTGARPWTRRVERIVARIAPTVIHAHFGPNGCAILPVAERLSIPLVTTFYGVDIAVLPHLPQWKARYAALLSSGQLFLAEGPEMRRKVIAAGASPDRTVLQRIGIQVHRYPHWEPVGSPPVALFVGRLIEKKGLVYALEAFARARRALPELTFRIIGAGPEMTAAQEIITREALTSHVTFLGMQPHARVIDELRRASVLVHPSVTARDGDSEGGAPTILLEAQAIGTPIVSTLHADIPYVVPLGDGVRLCRERDVEALAAALVDLVAHPKRIDSAFVRAHHDVAREIDRLESRYDEVAFARADALLHASTV